MFPLSGFEINPIPYCHKILDHKREIHNQSLLYFIVNYDVSKIKGFTYISLPIDFFCDILLYSLPLSHRTL
jgi:hypothetical protein